MRLIAAWLAFWLLAASPPPISNGPIRTCEGPEGSACRTVSLDDMPLTGPETRIERSVTVPPQALPLQRPLMVWLTAMASAEVYWNGVLIGRNGQPGPDRESERPGKFVSHFEVPPALVWPGINVVSLRVSAHHLWLPVRRPVHTFAVGLYETPSLPGLSDYVPALLTLGALLAAFIYFGASAFSDRRDRQARLLAGIAGLTALQLLVEVSRAFVAYSYPWHLSRVAAIALLSGATAMLATAYAARRFAPLWERRTLVVTGAAVLAILVLVPWYDPKAMGATLAGAFALIVCGIHGLRHGRTGAGVAVAGGLLAIALLSWQLTVFLDQSYYILVSGMLVILVAEQVNVLRSARQRRDQEAARSAALAERLSNAIEAGEPVVQLKDGSRIHRVPESDILYAKAADDYCDVWLVDGRIIFVTMSLARLLEGLSDRFLRVHKSYAVNRAHVTAQVPRPGGGRQLLLAGGASIPVGRSYGAVIGALAQPERADLRPSPAGG